MVHYDRAGTCPVSLTEEPTVRQEACLCKVGCAVKNQQQNHTQHFQKKQDEAQHQLAVAPRSWWRFALVGYPLAILFAILASLIPWSESLLHIQDHFVEPPFVVATFLVGWFWGIGPALLALVLEVLFLDYWIVPPLESIDFFRWPYIASFAPFIIIQLFILGLILVQKKYRQQLIESNAQLERANKVKEVFLSHISHELKTPLTTIQGQIQLALRRLARQQPLPAEFSVLPARLEMVDSQAHRLHAL